ncbi:DUF948 domain-containing protein [Leuconostocaceae bacterium ESL0958]|nr:DUF948 domain-containing protein [Leuconostocaceae bacterium ESL0958]
MTVGQLSFLIFALAFLLLVAFIGIFLLRLTRSLTVLTDDLDTIARSSNELLANTNILVDDVNDKMATLDVTVQAVADLSKTVSGMNDSAQKAGQSFSKFGAVSKTGAGFVLSRLAKPFSKKKQKKRK